MLSETFWKYALMLWKQFLIWMSPSSLKHSNLDYRRVSRVHVNIVAKCSAENTHNVSRFAECVIIFMHFVTFHKWIKENGRSINSSFLCSYGIEEYFTNCTLWKIESGQHPTLISRNWHKRHWKWLFPIKLSIEETGEIIFHPYLTANLIPVNSLKEKIKMIVCSICTGVPF